MRTFTTKGGQIFEVWESRKEALHDVADIIDGIRYQSKSGSVQTICCGCSTKTEVTIASVKKVKRESSRKSTSKPSLTRMTVQQ